MRVEQREGGKKGMKVVGIEREDKRKCEREREREIGMGERMNKTNMEKNEGREG